MTPQHKSFEELTVSVIGGAGHVGLPFSIVVANAGVKQVYGIDVDADKCDLLNQGEMIYIEEGGEDALRAAIAKGNILFTTDVNKKYLLVCRA